MKILILAIIIFFSGCSQKVSLIPIDGHNALADISKKGFAIDKAQAQKLDGKVVKVWGYIDFDNTSTCGRANWYFSIKSDYNDKAGESIHINTPAEYRFSEVYFDIRGMQKTDAKTKVLITGVFRTFNAPANFTSLLGVEIDVKSPEDIKFKP
ncbi:MAG TPA: hypothetical protein EYH01_05270 [Campylobacterales bacterium]|nr:hypothetical protein [Campylobacterales bacterium]